MIVVLAVYAAAVFSFVRRSVSQSLDQRLRGDLYWAAASVDKTAEGAITLVQEQQALLEEELPPWVQVWSPDGRKLLLSNSEAMRRPLQETQALAMEVPDLIVSVPTDAAPMRVLSRRFRIVDLPVVIQVARSESGMQQELQDLLLVLLFGMPLAVALAGIGGYTLARRALAPVERMTERARSITADRLSDRLPVAQP